MGAAKLADHSAKAAALFSNMRVPAAFLAGAVIPLAFAIPLPKTDRPERDRLYYLTNLTLGVLAFASELLAVVYTTVACNKLTETVSAPSSTVFALLGRDHELAWLGTNVCFLLGVFAACAMVVLRAALMANGSFAPLPTSLVAVAMLLMTSHINQGIADGDGAGSAFGTSFPSLLLRYGQLLAQQAASGTAPLVASALAVLAIGVLSTWRGCVLTQNR